MTVFLLVHEIRPLPTNVYYGGIDVITVRSHVRSDNLQAAVEFAEQWIKKDGWEIVRLLSAGVADPSGFGASTAKSQGHQFNFILTGLPESFLEEHNLLEDPDD